MKELKLYNSDKFAIVDDEDFDLISKYNWRLNSKDRGRICRSDGLHKSEMPLSNQVMGGNKDLLYDHKDRDIFNNQKLNLRQASYSQNAINRPKQKGSYSSKFKGVSFHKKQKEFVARLSFQGKSIQIGSFKTEQEAALAYNKKALELFGEFAVLNVI